MEAVDSINIVIMAPLHARRDWLERVARADPSVHVAGAAGTFPLLRSLIDQTDADVCVLDIPSTIEPQKLHDWLPEMLDLIPLILLSPDPDGWIFNNVLRIERGALLPADASAQQIVHAIHSVSIGLITIESSMIPRPEAAEGLTEELTPREADVLRLLAEGLGNREIANQLDITENTIKFHIRSILAKLGASTRTEAVTRGFRTGLIEL